MKPLLTVLIPCKDEQHNMLDCIESVRTIADEILVADSGSTDGTLEIVRGLPGVRVIEREYVNSANFKNWAIPQAAHEWVAGGRRRRASDPRTGDGNWWSAHREQRLQSLFSPARDLHAGASAPLLRRSIGYLHTTFPSGVALPGASSSCRPRTYLPRKLVS